MNWGGCKGQSGGTDSHGDCGAACTVAAFCCICVGLWNRWLTGDWCYFHPPTHPEGIVVSHNSTLDPPRGLHDRTVSGGSEELGPVIRLKSSCPNVRRKSPFSGPLLWGTKNQVTGKNQISCQVVTSEAKQTAQVWTQHKNSGNSSRLVIGTTRSGHTPQKTCYPNFTMKRGTETPPGTRNPGKHGELSRGQKHPLTLTSSVNVHAKTWMCSTRVFYWTHLESGFHRRDRHYYFPQFLWLPHLRAEAPWGIPGRRKTWRTPWSRWPFRVPEDQPERTAEL